MVISHWLQGELAPAEGPTAPVHNPTTGRVIAEVPLGGSAEVNRAVGVAREAFESWSRVPLKERVAVFYRYRELLARDRRTLAAQITEEHGKVRAEAEAEVDKAIELTEFACSLPQIAGGEVLEVGRSVTCRLERYPLGVVTSITPFNFPIMVPHWTIPNALVLGNALILKPSERVPLSAMRTAELLAEAGVPPGVFSVVHGARDTVEALCDHPGIAGVTFVGSTPTAQAVYRRASHHLKRVLALGGAKNHLFVFPDADPGRTASNALTSAIGCSGQRCMAGSVLVAIADTEEIIRRLVEGARALVPGRDYGPVISRAAKERIEGAITEAEAEGAKVLVDGRGLSVPGLEEGFFVGPTIIDGVRPEMRIAQVEVFGPVLAIVRVKTLEEALALEARSPYGNAASVFTRSAASAERVVDAASAGMVGVNLGVPVPREPFGFGGWNASRYGVGDITGRSSIEFWTQSKKITTTWPEESR